MAFRSSSSASSSTGTTTVAKPSGVVDGDIILTVCLANSLSSGNRVTPDRTFTYMPSILPHKNFASVGIGLQCFIICHVASNEPDNYNFLFEKLLTNSWVTDTSGDSVLVLAYDSSTLLSFGVDQDTEANGIGSTTISSVLGAKTNPIAGYTTPVFYLGYRSDSGTYTFTPDAALTHRADIAGVCGSSVGAKITLYSFDETFSGTAVAARTSTVQETTAARTCNLHGLRIWGGTGATSGFGSSASGSDAWAWTA